MTVSKVDAANQIENQLPQANIAGNVNFRNIIINGDMSIAQRGTSQTNAGSVLGIHQTLDRWKFYNNSLGAFTWSQDTDVPTGQGFANSMKFDCTTADASPAAGDYLVIQQLFEGQNVQYLKKGTSSAESLTLSFWVKSNKTGTYIIEILDNDNSRSIAKSYTIDSASTWEKKTITFDGDTSGVLDNDNGGSLGVEFWLGAGSNYTSGTLQTSWGTRVEANRAVGQVNLADSTANDFYITGIQLEAGDTASDFEFLPHDMNLARCQRYCYVPINTSNGSNQSVGNFNMYNSTYLIGHIFFPITMRANPSFTSSDNSGDFTFYRNGAGDNFDTFNIALELHPNGANIRNSTQVSGTAGHAGFVVANNSTSKLTFTAEL